MKGVQRKKKRLHPVEDSFHPVRVYKLGKSDEKYCVKAVKDCEVLQVSPTRRRLDHPALQGFEIFMAKESLKEEDHEMDMVEVSQNGESEELIQNTGSEGPGEVDVSESSVPTKIEGRKKGRSKLCR
ncbi:hypothetical protein R1flu_028489 [Riccia fluitans]|uniref:Uncharacterized protein n=1 Tax=Riccia fluitans TaxID=41844 RepID=A0ABD1XPP1_9MARC